ncbi:hypothetical protein [Streptomyces catenulae]|uniref:DUF4232 domain-containing protein n=1 Tax=Streptomyces catenulae TaxID=66875 RepID=A0ABV2Z7S1_9ACTN|nr:hypothetical protein [Streptomyces catenulae]
MGSLRNPIGPLPSSIYWRRRAVALGIFALLALLVVWILNWGGGSGPTDTEGKGAADHGPADAITPGPSSTGPAISQKPGGRDESGSGGGGGNGTGGSGSGSGDSGSGGAGSDDAGSGGSGKGPIGTGTGGAPVAAGSSLPSCSGSSVELTLRSVKDSYHPGTKPEFELTVKNTGGADCKVDLGAKAAVLTITDTTADDPVWASDDCPKSATAALMKIPAHGAVTRTVTWDRRAGGPQCATPSAATVPAGKYRVEAAVPGLTAVHTEFTLAKD